MRVTATAPTNWSALPGIDDELAADFAAVEANAAQVGAHVTITLGAADSITLANFTLANLQAGDFLFV